MTCDFTEFLSQFVTEHKRQVFERVLQQRTRYLTVVLEDIFQPHNASACLRSCDAFGIQNVHIVEDRHAYRLNSDVELGSAQWLTLKRYAHRPDNTRHCIESLRKAGYAIVATSPHPDADLLETFEPDRPCALLFGTELEGLSSTALENADVRLRIPLYGFTPSLNISVAVAICLHELTGKLRRSGIDWRLREWEQDELRLEWMKNVIGRKRLPVIEAEFHRRFAGAAGSRDAKVR